MRFICEIDEDRRKAGWGEHFWLVDRKNSARLRLLSKQEAIVEAQRLNSFEIKRWFAWHLVWLEDGSVALLQHVWARHEFIGGMNTERFYPPSKNDALVWRYYRKHPGYGTTP